MHASLDQAGGMVSFVESPEYYDSLPMVHHMETQLQECVALQMKLASLDKQLALDPRYAHKVSLVVVMYIVLIVIVSHRTFSAFVWSTKLSYYIYSVHSKPLRISRQYVRTFKSTTYLHSCW